MLALGKLPAGYLASLSIAFGQYLPATQEGKMAYAQGNLNDLLEVGVNVTSWPGNEAVYTWSLEGRAWWFDRRAQPVGVLCMNPRFAAAGAV